MEHRLGGSQWFFFVANTNFQYAFLILHTQKLLITSDIRKKISRQTILQLISGTWIWNYCVTTIDTKKWNSTTKYYTQRCLCHLRGEQGYLRIKTTFPTNIKLLFFSTLHIFYVYSICKNCIVLVTMKYCCYRSIDNEIWKHNEAKNGNELNASIMNAKTKSYFSI